MPEIFKSCFNVLLIWSLLVYVIVVVFEHKKTQLVFTILLTIVMGLGLTSNIMSINHYYKKIELEKQIKLEEQEKEKQLLLEQQEKQIQFLLEQQEKEKEKTREKEKLEDAIRKFSDYYFDYTKQDFDSIQDDIFDFGTYSFVVKKNNDSKSIEFTLIQNSDNTIIKSQIRHYQ